VSSSYCLHRVAEAGDTLGQVEVQPVRDVAGQSLEDDFPVVALKLVSVLLRSKARWPDLQALEQDRFEGDRKRVGVDALAQSRSFSGRR
jgi:hypothetical protein